MRLVKLIAYSLLGYVLYELYLGMTESVTQPPSAKADRAPDIASGTEPAKTVAVKDGRGARTKRVVGRGVIH